MCEILIRTELYSCWLGKRLCLGVAAGGLTYRFHEILGDYELYHDFNATSMGTITSIRWIPRPKSERFFYITSHGECGIRNLETKTSEYLFSKKDHEYLSMDLNSVGEKLAVGEKSGMVAELDDKRLKSSTLKLLLSL